MKYILLLITLIISSETLYASDPQGGYAMIRPGGGCPACSALSQAR